MRLTPIYRYATPLPDVHLRQLRITLKPSRVRLLKVLNHQRDAGFVATTTATCFDAFSPTACPATSFRAVFVTSTPASDFSRARPSAPRS